MSRAAGSRKDAFFGWALAATCLPPFFPGFHPQSPTTHHPHPPSPRSYTKFLVDRDGVARKRFKPSFDPLDFEADVRLLLAGRDPQPPECIAHPGRKVCKVDLDA